MYMLQNIDFMGLYVQNPKTYLHWMLRFDFYGFLRNKSLSILSTFCSMDLSVLPFHVVYKDQHLTAAKKKNGRIGIWRSPVSLSLVPSGFCLGSFLAQGQVSRKQFSFNGMLHLGLLFA